MLLFFLDEKEKLGKLPLSTTPCFLGGQDDAGKMKLFFVLFLNGYSQVSLFYCVAEISQADSRALPDMFLFVSSM